MGGRPQLLAVGHRVCIEASMRAVVSGHWFIKVVGPVGGHPLIGLLTVHCGIALIVLFASPR